jgi:hypothetical protein
MGLIVSSKASKEIMEAIELQSKRIDSGVNASNDYNDLINKPTIPEAQRGVAVFVSETEPTDMRINDLWYQI